MTVQLSELPEPSREQYELVPLEDLTKQFDRFTYSMAIQVVEFSNREYKIRKEIIEF